MATARQLKRTFSRDARKGPLSELVLRSPLRDGGLQVWPPATRDTVTDSRRGAASLLQVRSSDG